MMWIFNFSNISFQLLLDSNLSGSREKKNQTPMNVQIRPKIKSLKPKKKIVIRKFVKNAPSKTIKRTPKTSKLLELLKSSKLTPAEFLYLSELSVFLE